MNYETYLLNALLDKYERSSLFRTGQGQRRILFKPSENQRMQPFLRDGQGQQAFLRSVQALKAEGIVDFKWLKFEEENIIQEIWLVADSKSIAQAYEKVQRLPKAVLQKQLVEVLSKERGNFQVYEYELLLEAILLEASEKQRDWSTPFDLAGLREILAVLSYLENQPETISDKRLLSIAVFNDSKYFERNIQAKLLGLFGKYVFEWSAPELTVTEKLHDIGIGKAPGELHFGGGVKCHFADGHVLDATWYQEGFILSEGYVKQLKKITGRFTKLMTIENLANYYWFLRKQAKAGKTDCLIFYTAGFLSKNQIRFLESIEKPESLAIHHWGDIDLGGLGIFQQLQGIFPSCQPYHMDVATFTKYEGLRKPVSQEYLAKAQRLLLNEDFSRFKEVLQQIIATREILEQEAELTAIRDDREESGDALAGM